MRRVLDTIPIRKLGFVTTDADSERSYGYGYGYDYAYGQEPAYAPENEPVS
jgi:hypothetical protein